MAMNLGENFFDDITERADPQLRLLHCPPIAKSIVEQEGHTRIIPHTDFGLCTLLFQDSVGGLEVDPFHTGDFKAAVPVPGTVLINIADLLQRLTNDRCRSTVHKVVSPKTAGLFCRRGFRFHFSFTRIQMRGLIQLLMRVRLRSMRR
jgi:isopenicillin N synthase-like dioxygenase